ncbi:type II toxin-antitoxin system VapC family toxin [Nocardia sp. NPDC059764]|uniref:type II toxin-antitoxin system VapC family toxin n=1 Tax=Nocardia sp. NPDC059764 TaxID=3346939 RepID=UPI00364B5E63
MIVVDANAMVLALVDPSTKGDEARAALVADDDWCAPAHMPLEVQRTLHKAVLQSHIKASDADSAVSALISMQFEYVPADTTLQHAVWAMRHNVSTYDAAYLAVAMLNDAALVTFDARLAKVATMGRTPISVTLLPRQQP